VSIVEATHFDLTYLENGCKRITDGTGQTLLLVPREAPVDVSAAEKDLVIEIPIKRAVMCSTPLASLLRVLGETDSIVGVSTPRADWFIDEIVKGMDEGKIAYLGEIQMDYEQLMTLDPEIVFIGSHAAGAKLDVTGLPVAFYSGYLEKDPLGQLEWIKFVAAFYNKEQVAQAYIDRIKHKLDTIRRKTATARTVPKVLWAYVYDGTTSAAGGDSYVCRMIAMAGGDFVFKNLKVTGNMPITFETLYAKGKAADIFIVPSTPNFGITSIRAITSQHSTLAEFKAVRAGALWCFQPWWWQALDRSDEIVADLAAIFHPELFPGHVFKHFLKLPP
jgi:iron complex transport system substrate-binding protein